MKKAGIVHEGEQEGKKQKAGISGLFQSTQAYFS
jgi:hypothetical protein